MNPVAMAFQQKLQQHANKILNKYIGDGGNEYTQLAPRRNFHEEMAQYFADIRDGKTEIPDAMAEALCMVAIESVSAYVGKHEAMKARLSECESTGELMTEQHEQHKKYKALVEELRDITMNQQKEKFIADHFCDLTPDEKHLLMLLSKDYSKKSKAAEMHVSIEELERIKKNIETKIK